MVADAIVGMVDLPASEDPDGARANCLLFEEMQREAAKRGCHNLEIIPIKD